MIEALVLLVLFCYFSFSETRKIQSEGNLNILHFNYTVLQEGALRLHNSELCLDNLQGMFGYEMLGFRDCNGSGTQKWKFLLSGQLVQSVTGLCASYYPYWNNLMITNCSLKDSLQIWKQECPCINGYSKIYNEGLLFQNMEYYYLAQDGMYAELTTDWQDYYQTFGFFSWPFSNPAPPSPSPSPLPNPNYNSSNQQSSLPIGIILIVGIAIIFTVCCNTMCIMLLRSTVRRRQQQQQLQQSNNDEQLPMYRWDTATLQDTLATQKFTSGVASSEVICCICLEELQEGDEETILACAHQFHKQCFDEWLKIQGRKVTCPLCNTQLNQTLQSSQPNLE